MNGLGVGTSVGLGALIGLGFVAPEVTVTEYLATVACYGLLSGFLFEMFRIAFSARRPSRR